MAAAGSQTATNWYDDVSKVVFYCDLRTSERFGQLNTGVQKPSETKQLIGNGLGGLVILGKQIRNLTFAARTYNAPVIQMSCVPQGNR